MKVDGWLERAQLENIASAAPTPVSTGRVYADTTAPTAAVPRFYDGTAWRQMLLGQATPLVSQNSGTSVTVNWATGLNQQVVLTGHCIISFSNPQAGMQHNLVVTQKASDLPSTTPFLYRLNLPDQLTRRMAYQPYSVLQSSESDFLSWFYSSNIKPAYATIPTAVTASSATLATLMTGIDVWPGIPKSGVGSGNTIAGGRTSSPFVQSMRYVDGGAKFWPGRVDITAATAAAAQIVALNYHPDGHTIFYASGTSPFIQAFGVDIYGVGNQPVYANPGTLPAGAGQCIAVHPSGSHVVIGHTTTPFISCYPIASYVFGTKVTNPASLPVAQVNAVAWSPCGDFLAVASQTTPFIEVYPFDPNTGFGTKVTAPVTLPVAGPPGSLGKGLHWHPSGNFIAMGMSTTPFFYIVAFNRSSGAFGASVSVVPVSGPAATVNCIQFSPCGNFLAMGNSANLFIFNFSAQTIGTALLYDVAGPAVQVNDIVWHPSGELLTMALNASPFIVTYPAPRVQKNYIKLVM